MAERASLSLDPYVNSPGFLAADLAIDAEAFDRIIEAGKIRRQIAVVWTNEQPQGHRLGFARRQTQLPLVQRRGETVLKINDDLLLEKARRRAKKRSDNNEGNYNALTREEFVGAFSREVAGALTSSIYTDKVSLREHFLNHFGMTMVTLSVLAHIPPNSLHELGILGVIGGGTSYLLWRLDKAEIDEKGQQLFAPARFVRGYWEILKNQSQLIIDREHF